MSNFIVFFKHLWKFDGQIPNSCKYISISLKNHVAGFESCDLLNLNWIITATSCYCDIKLSQINKNIMNFDACILKLHEPNIHTHFCQENHCDKKRVPILVTFVRGLYVQGLYGRGLYVICSPNWRLSDRIPRKLKFSFAVLDRRVIKLNLYMHSNCPKYFREEHPTTFFFKS